MSLSASRRRRVEELNVRNEFLDLADRVGTLISFGLRDW
jgi:hypothetical protein